MKEETDCMEQAEQDNPDANSVPFLKNVLLVLRHIQTE